MDVSGGTANTYVGEFPSLRDVATSYTLGNLENFVLDEDGANIVIMMDDSSKMDTGRIRAGINTRSRSLTICGITAADIALMSTVTSPKHVIIFNATKVIVHKVFATLNIGSKVTAVFGEPNPDGIAHTGRTLSALYKKLNWRLMGQAKVMYTSPEFTYQSTGALKAKTQMKQAQLTSVSQCSKTMTRPGHSQDSP